MISQTQLADQFRLLHNRDVPLILPNAWDPLSAAIVAGAGFPAVATASAAVALSRGFDDGENVPFEELAGLVSRISAVLQVPLSVDFEKGYGETLEDLRTNTLSLIAAGAVGVNLEDSLDHDTLRPIEEQCNRVSAVRDAGTKAGVPLFINARTDVFMIGQNSSAEDAAISRLIAYCEAGADGVYPILCSELSILERIHAATDKPINVLLRPSTPSVPTLMDVGVRRISLGPRLLSIAAGATSEAVQRLASGDLNLGDLPQLNTAQMRSLQGIEPGDRCR